MLIQMMQPVITLACSYANLMLYMAPSRLVPCAHPVYVAESSDCGGQTVAATQFSGRLNR